MAEVPVDERSERQAQPKERVLRLAYPDMDNAWVLISGQKNDGPGADIAASKPVTSFLYDAGNVCAEWCPPHGPIQLWWKGEEGDDPHYFYEYRSRGDWSQMAVDREGLHEAFLAGNFDMIFDALQKWSENR